MKKINVLSWRYYPGIVNTSLWFHPSCYKLWEIMFETIFSHLTMYD